MEQMRSTEAGREVCRWKTACGWSPRRRARASVTQEVRQGRRAHREGCPGPHPRPHHRRAVEELPALPPTSKSSSRPTPGSSPPVGPCQATAPQGTGAVLPEGRPAGPRMRTWKAPDCRLKRGRSARQARHRPVSTTSPSLGEAQHRYSIGCRRSFAGPAHGSSPQRRESHHISSSISPSMRFHSDSESIRGVGSTASTSSRNLLTKDSTSSESGQAALYESSSFRNSKRQWTSDATSRWAS